MTWVEPAAAEHGEPTEWIVRCSRCPTMTWSRWSQERFAVACAVAHERECGRRHA